MVSEYYLNDLYIRHAIDEKPDDRHFTMHIHLPFEIYFFVSGNVEYLVEGSKYPLKYGSVMIMNSIESHRPKILGPQQYERFVVNFPVSFLNKFDENNLLAKPFTDRQYGKGNLIKLTESDAALFEKLFKEMLYREKNVEEKKITVCTHLLTMLDIINQLYITRTIIEHNSPDLMERIIYYVNCHLFDENLTVPLLAEQFCLSTSQFTRIFRQGTGVSPWEYVIRKRLTSAREKIASGISAQQASELCGFGDYSSFYRAYVKYFGKAPKIAKTTLYKEDFNRC
jgi:AraC-like DNA-binding protein